MSMTPSRRQIESYTLGDAAKDRKLFIVRCSPCRASSAYLASDLAEIGNPNLSVIYMEFRCAHCGKLAPGKMRHPTSDDVGHLKIRRPNGVKTIHLWAETWYGPEPAYVEPVPDPHRFHSHGAPGQQYTVAEATQRQLEFNRQYRRNIAKDPLSARPHDVELACRLNAEFKRTGKLPD